MHEKKTYTGKDLCSLIYSAIITCAADWVYICVTIKLIALCFGFTFTWRIATGTWLTTRLLRTIFKNGTIQIRGNDKNKR